MHRFDSAEEEYVNALDIAPGNEEARLGLAAVLLGKNETDRSIAELQKALPGTLQIKRYTSC